MTSWYVRAMLLDRRSFAIASTALLTGCATTSTGRRTSIADCSPLVPVKVEEGRVIRTVAGLRPYRASGFVVRAEALGDKRLVHNYGHGGAGITLSWGSSKLATGLGLQGHGGPVAVIGAGIMGLTTARLVQEAGFPVTIYTAALPPDTTSNVAGGQWNPFGHFRDDAVTPEWRQQFRVAADYSWRRFQIMVGEDYGVRWLPTYNESDGGGEEDRVVPTFPAAWQRLSAHEHPFAIDNLTRYDTIYVETGRFLARLLNDIRLAEGRVEVRRFATPADLAALPEQLIFNCTGLGSRDLFGDEELVPVRGQLAILLPQPEVRYAFTGEAGYMFPRPDGIILGGTFERGEWSTVPDPADIRRIVDSHRRLFAGFRCAA
ncbi:MAG TPA: FAD-dependent oxidoreductase [Sphingomicrobium sp.]|nr:FAD-dependent oxidoreductase [Sphingomicrobium sp.]